MNSSTTNPQSSRRPQRWLLFNLCLLGTVGWLAVDNPTSGQDLGDTWARMRPNVPQRYVCLHTNDELAVDGRLDEDAWNNAAWTSDFVDIEGAVKPKPRFRTRAKMLWSDRYFYIAAVLEEPHIWGTLTEHDSVIFHDNDFEVFIDPDGDNHEYYEFEINALNTGWDLFLPKPYSDGGRADNSWEIPGLKTAVYLDGTLNDPTDEDRFWSLEIAIPWNALAEFAHRPAPPRDGDHWRVNFSRVEWRHLVEENRYRKVPDTREDNWVWSPQGIINMHRPERWGFVKFVRQSTDSPTFDSVASLPQRDALMAIYHRQKAFRKLQGRWATTLAELSAAELRDRHPTLKLTASDSGFVATIDDGADQQWRIREDSQLRRVPVR